MADYEFETLDEWIEKGSFNNTNFKDVKDSDSKISDGTYYTNYKDVVNKAIDAGNLDKAEATVKAHGFDWNAPSSTEEEEDDDEIVLELPDKPVTPPPGERPDYEGPPYYDPRTFDPTPSYLDLQELEPEDYVSNRMAMLFNKGSPLFRQVSELAARQYGNRGPRAQEIMMGNIIKVGQKIAEAEALMRERYKGKLNDAFFKQMDIRMSGAMQQAVTHISGEFGLTVATMQDITNQWKAQLAADMQAYNIDTGAAVSTYATKLQYALGLKGLDVKMADIMSKIEDNAEAASFIWDWIYGDNDLNPSEYHEWWKKKWGDQADDDDATTTTDLNATWINAITNQLNAGNCAQAKKTAENTKNEAHYNSIVGADDYRGTCTPI